MEINESFRPHSKLQFTGMLEQLLGSRELLNPRWDTTTDYPNERSPVTTMELGEVIQAAYCLKFVQISRFHHLQAATTSTLYIRLSYSHNVSQPATESISRPHRHCVVSASIQGEHYWQLNRRLIYYRGNGHFELERKYGHH